MTIKYCSVLFFLISFLCANAQIEFSLRLNKISIKGLQKTKPNLIKSLLFKDEGEPVTLMDLKLDAQQVRNFAGIGDVSLSLDTIDNRVDVVYTVSEIRTLLPIINFGGIDGNVWYELGFSDINWLGKGHNISGSYRNSDRRHSGQLYYRVPSIGFSKWGYSVSLSRWASIEPLFFENNTTVRYNFDFNSIGLTGIYSFTPQRQIEFGGSYFVEKYEKLNENSQEILPGPDVLTQPKTLSRFQYTEDHIDYYNFIQDGFAWNALFQNVFNFNDNTTFNSLLLHATYYKILKEKINIASRLRMGFSTNNNSPFAPFVVDSHVNLRGVGNRIDRGTAQIVFNLEMRRTIYDKNKWASQVVAFSDLGTWRNPGGELNDLFNSDQFRHFLGGGFRIIYKKVYGSVIRVDYGVDIYNPSENGLVIGYGQYF